jgi:hypothetical protein
MNAELYERLRQGSITNVIFYGNIKDPAMIAMPPCPYVVVKRVESGIAGFSRLQFFIHGAQGSAEIITRYAVKELTELLRKPLQCAEGVVPFRDTGIFVPDIPVSNDKSISCRRDFDAPFLVGIPEE